RALHSIWCARHAGNCARTRGFKRDELPVRFADESVLQAADINIVPRNHSCGVDAPASGPLVGSCACARGAESDDLAIGRTQKAVIGIVGIEIPTCDHPRGVYDVAEVPWPDAVPAPGASITMIRGLPCSNACGHAVEIQQKNKTNIRMPMRLI